MTTLIHVNLIGFSKQIIHAGHKHQCNELRLLQGRPGVQGSSNPVARVICVIV